MLIARLTHLMESGQYQQCLLEATALLNAGGLDAGSRARIHAAACRCALELTDYGAAVAAGEQAEDLAGMTGDADLLGAVLVDLATAQSEMRRYDAALRTLDRYREGLTRYTAARCLEGVALQRSAAAYARCGCPRTALESYEAALRWFERYGDARSACACTRAMVQLHLNSGQAREAKQRLESARVPRDSGLMCDHLLDWAACCLADGETEQATRYAYAALDLAGDDLERQAEANLVLARSAARPVEAFTFALAARISAIDSRRYLLEFAASELIVDLLRSGGPSVLQEAEDELARQGVNLYHYLPER